MAKYDLAISFAGEQRRIANYLARRLDSAGYSIFYDRFATSDIWGHDLMALFSRVYSEESRFCLVIVSREYVSKAWTNLERQNALARFMNSPHGYLLCLLTDGSKLPGLPSTVGDLDLREHDLPTVYRLLLERLGPPHQVDPDITLTTADRDLAKRVLQACYTRAIFTRMFAEIVVSAMYESINRTMNDLQQIVPAIHDQALQYTVVQILGALDHIDRTRRTASSDFGAHLRDDERQLIDSHKQEVIRLLLEVRRRAQLAIQLPYTLGNEIFMSVEGANGTPGRWGAEWDGDDE